MIVKGFDEKSDRVPEIDETYKFDPDTTLAILAGQPGLLKWCRDQIYKFRQSLELGQIFHQNL